jgi:ubiquinone biosynthesis protein UbiJ
LSFIEAELNRCVGESTAARELLARLNGTSFALHVEGLGLTAVLHAEGDRLRVDSDAAGATATLRAAPLDLVRLVNAEGVSGVKRTRADLSGDLEVAERYAKLLKLARPDLEEEVAKWLGDVPAHALGDVVRGARAWLERAGAALRMNAAEYLQEESRAMPAPLEARAFYADVERLRDDVERAAARLKRLEQRA